MALGMVLFIGRSTTLVILKVSQHLLDGLLFCTYIHCPQSPPGFGDLLTPVSMRLAYVVLSEMSRQLLDSLP